MGTDIHVVVQAKRGSDWHDEPCPGFDWQDEYTRGKWSWYEDRNYDAFAILANVRNGYGCAGVATGDELIPICGSKRRGLPPGFIMDPDRDRHNGRWMGDHSFHWVTLRELVEYPHWEKVRLSAGVITAKAYVEREARAEKPKVNDPPKSYCGAVMGEGVRTFDEAAFLHAGSPVDEKTYVRIQWSETYGFSAGELYNKAIPSLVKWAEEEGLVFDDVRMVMGFDS